MSSRHIKEGVNGGKGEGEIEERYNGTTVQRYNGAMV
jgi:hypothetical protein